MEKEIKTLVYMFDVKTGKPAKIYNSIKEAAEANSLNEDAVINSILYDIVVCERYFFTKHVANYKSVKSLTYDCTHRKGKRHVMQLTLDGKEIQTFTSVVEATRVTGITCIDKAARGIYGHAGGFLWKYCDTYITSTSENINDELY